MALTPGPAPVASIIAQRMCILTFGFSSLAAIQEGDLPKCRVVG